MTARKRAILIAGPTASGKSAAALCLAERLGGVVINADSMQVYADLRVLTARPSPEEEARAPHVLYGHVDAGVRHSVDRWLKEARAEAQKAWVAGRLPIFTGGTGLYFRALEEGLAEVPPVPDEVRARVKGIFQEGGVEALRAEAARHGISDALDRQRLVRALEVLIATGKPLEEFQRRQERSSVLDGVDVVRLFIAPERELLRERISQRFDIMLQTGAVEEVERLMARGLDPSLPAMKAHGVRNIAAALRGEITMAEAARQAVNETRQYAKRQMSWARKYMSGWTWACNSADGVKTALDLWQARG